MHPKTFEHPRTPFIRDYPRPVFHIACVMMHSEFIALRRNASLLRVLRVLCLILHSMCNGAFRVHRIVSANVVQRWPFAHMLRAMCIISHSVRKSLAAGDGDQCNPMNSRMHHYSRYMKLLALRVTCVEGQRRATLADKI